MTQKKGYSAQAMPEPAVKTRIAPSNSNKTTKGISHHFFSCRENSRNSLNSDHMERFHSNNLLQYNNPKRSYRAGKATSTGSARVWRARQPTPDPLPGKPDKIGIVPLRQCFAFGCIIGLHRLTPKKSLK